MVFLCSFYSVHCDSVVSQVSAYLYREYMCIYLFFKAPPACVLNKIPPTKRSASLHVALLMCKAQSSYRCVFWNCHSQKFSGDFLSSTMLISCLKQDLKYH